MPEYRPAPELVRMHEQISQALAAEGRRAATSVNLRGTEVLQRVLPLIEAVMGFSAGVQGDLATYAEQLAGESEAEVLFGLDDATFEDLDVEISAAMSLATELLSVDEAKTSASKVLDHLARLRDALADLVLEGDEGGDEEGDDEALEVEE